MQCNNVFEREDYGENMKMNETPLPKQNAIKMLTPPYTQLPENTSVVCKLGGKKTTNATSDSKGLLSSTMGNANFVPPTIYRVMKDGSIRDYPDDIIKCYSWNPYYDAEPLQYPDCSKYDIGPTLDYSADMDRSVEAAINFEGTLANYMNTYNNLGWQDISINMIKLQTRFDSLIMGRLMSGEWSDKDINAFNIGELSNVLKDLEKKGETGSHTAGKLQQGLGSLFSKISWPDYPVNLPISLAINKDLVLSDDSVKDSVIRLRNFDPSSPRHYWSYIPETGQIKNNGTGRCMRINEYTRRGPRKSKVGTGKYYFVTTNCDKKDNWQKFKITKQKILKSDVLSAWGINKGAYIIGGLKDGAYLETKDIEEGSPFQQFQVRRH
jgi:hypothetical protein